MKRILKQFNFETVMYLAFAIYMAVLFLSNVCVYFLYPIIPSLFRILKLFCYAIFAFQILRDWINGKNITWTMILLGFLSILVFYFSKSKEIFFLVLLLFSCRSFDFQKLLKITLGIFGSLYFLVVLFSFLHIIPDWTYGTTVIKHSLGFYYSTIAIGLYLSIVFMYLYWRREKVTIWELMALEGINIFLYSFTLGRMSFLLISFLLFIFALFKWKLISSFLQTKFCRIFFKVVASILPFFLFFLVLGVSVTYDTKNSMMVQINDVFSNRISLSHRALKEYSITLFGQPIEWRGNGGNGYVPSEKKLKYNYVDTSYVRILLDYGVVTLLLVLVAYSWILFQKQKSHDIYGFSIFICILIWGVIEPYLISIEHNIFILEFLPLLEIGKIDFFRFDHIKKVLKREDT